MPSLRRRAGLPDDVRRSLSLARGERVLVHAPLTGGGTAVVTARALHLRGTAEAGTDWHVVPWHRVLRASYDDESESLVVEESGTEERPALTHRLATDEPSLLPEAVRERVTASIVVARQVRLTGSKGVRVVGRRVPGSDEVLWQVIWDRGVNPEMDGADEKVREALAELREQTGALER